MYKIVKTDKSFPAKVSHNLAIHRPIMTLADEYGGRCQLVVDDHCLNIYLKNKKDEYDYCRWIFEEVIDAIYNNYDFIKDKISYKLNTAIND